MDISDRVLHRLARIEELRGRGTGPELLRELQALVPEAEAWARAEGDARAWKAVEKLVGAQRRAETCRGGEGMS
jgi:hypothetical protein